MDSQRQPEANQMTTMEELRDRMPNLHPYFALMLTLEPMARRGEIATEQYLKWAAVLVLSHQKPLFGEN